MSEWATEGDPFAQDSAPLRNPGEAAGAADDPGRSTESDGEGASGALAVRCTCGAGNGDTGGLCHTVDCPRSAHRLHVPDFMRRAMEAQGIDPDEVAARAAAAEVIPSDEQAMFLEAAARTGGLRCEGCKTKVSATDVSMLVEVTGWSKHRSQGGQNHVIDRAETGRVMCGECGQRLIHLGAVGYAQESMV